MKLNLAAHPPFSLSSVVKSHGWIALAPFSLDDHRGGFTYVDQLAAGRVVRYLVREAPGGVAVEVDGHLSKAEADEVARKVQWMLGLYQDFSAFYSLAYQEPNLARAVEEARGRILRSATFFEDIAKTILTTNTTWSGTIRMVDALVSQFGAPLPDDPSMQAFPTPERLAESDEGTLRASTRLGYRAPYILGLARSVASGDLDLESLKSDDLSTDELRKQLLAIKGVGAYAAANLLMLLGRYDFLPIDSWALKMVSNEWYGGESVSPTEVEAAFEKWGQWKGLAFWFWDWSE